MNATAAIAAIIAILPTLSKYAGVASAAVEIISWLEQLVPLFITGAKDLYQPIKNVIADLRGNPALTKDDLDKLDAYEAQIDAKFDAAAAAAEAEDAASTEAPAATQ